MPAGDGQVSQGFVVQQAGARGNWARDAERLTQESGRLSTKVFEVEEET